MLSLIGHTSDVTALAFSPDGSRLASASWDGTLRIWPRYGGEPLVLRTGNDHALCVAFSPDGTHLAAGFRSRHPAMLGHGYGNLAYFPLYAQPGRAQITIRHSDTWSPYPASSGTDSIAFCPTNAAFIITAGSVSAAQSKLDCGIYLYRMPDRDRVALFMSSRFVRSIAFCPDGTEVAAVARKAGLGVSVWNIPSKPKSQTQTIEPLHSCPVAGEIGAAVGYSPDGETVVAAFESGLLIFWVPGEEPMRMRTRHARAALRSVTISPDGQLFATAGSDGIVKVWDRPTRRLLSSFDWKIGEIHCVAFAPDGLTLAAGGQGPIVVWDV